jgi:hypothetical protein
MCCCLVVGLQVALRALIRTSREIAQGMLHIHDSKVVHGGELLQHARG